MRRGEIHLCDFGTPTGHEAGFRRPALVVSHDGLNRHGLSIVAPITRTRRGYATHVELDGVLPVVSYVQCELIRAVSQVRLVRNVAALDMVAMAGVDAILRRLLDV